jgi:pilus assembly protein FimV
MSLPGAARALGLGEIRVNSALNEPLSAQIGLLGATPEELSSITARLADEAMFQRNGADRPAFLSTVSFKVARDANGLPVLEVRSAAPLVDPIIDLLVDVRWPQGELVRNFPLLLDPLAVATKRRGAAAPATIDRFADLAPVVLRALPSAVYRAPAMAPASPVAPAIEPGHEASPTPAASRSEAVYHVLPRDTLFDIVRRAGAVSEADVQQMMIAVFLANPQAFDRNINILRRGALLSMPSASDAAAVDPAEARRIVASQRQAWRRYSIGADYQPVASGLIALPPGLQTPGDLAATAILDQRVQSLEAALEAERQQVASMKAEIEGLRQPAPLQPVPAPTAAITTPPTPLIVRAGSSARATPLGALGLFLGLPLVGLLVLAAQRWRKAAARRLAHRPSPAAAVKNPFQPEASWLVAASQPESPATTVEVQVLDGVADAPRRDDDEATVSMLADTQRLEQLEADCAAAEAASVAAQSPDGVTVETAMPQASAAQSDLEGLQGTVLDYNLMELDSRASHVHMPSDLNDRSNFVERRTNIVDALRTAIERDPYRRDLCIKLLETYHSMAAANRRAFQEFVLSQASEPSSLSAEDWQKIVAMGQEIALEISLPAEEEDGDLADCA